MPNEERIRKLIRKADPKLSEEEAIEAERELKELADIVLATMEHE